MCANTASRSTLDAWLAEYSAIEVEYLEGLRKRGIDLAAPHALDSGILRARAHCAASGACLRNGGASVCVGSLSSACVACTGDCGSKTFFLSLACNRGCYFCFNSNQAGHEKQGRLNVAWREELDAYFASIGGAANATHIGLTGGEPLLHADDALAFIAHAHACAPQAHIRLYTAGDFLDAAMLSRLRDAGLEELRLSVKLDVLDTPDETVAEISRAANLIQLASRFISQPMVEMPVIPGTGEAMRMLLRALDNAGAWGINLLEFGYPFNDWKEFARRGFQVKNPPYPVLYDWDYAGGLPIEGSELLALELVQFAIDEGLRLGVHYCSLENKNRDQVATQNRAYVPDPAVYVQDEGDFLYKTLKAFDGDIEVVEAALGRAGASDAAEREGDCLLVHPRCAGMLADEPVCLAMSSNIVESRDGGIVLREVKLECLETGMPTESERWAVRATAWELAALSLRYPETALVDAVASGEWAAAAREIVAALGAELPAEFDAIASAACKAIAQEGEDSLKTEATRLFIGAPHAACSPYEGVRRSTLTGSNPLLFVSRYAMGVERFCKACGFARPEGTNEPLDHIATECELLERLALAAADTGFDQAALPGGSAAAAYGQFMSEHAAVWFEEFADSLAVTTTHPFYRATAMYLGALCNVAF